MVAYGLPSGFSSIYGSVDFNHFGLQPFEKEQAKELRAKVDAVDQRKDAKEQVLKGELLSGPA